MRKGNKMTVAELKKKLELLMHNVYQECEPDLPRHGSWHFATAVDCLADRAHDELWTMTDGVRPKSINLKAMATKVVREYTSNDSALSKRKDDAQQRKLARREKEPRKRKEPREKRWDDYPPRNKGIGSL
jgi:hypothetical protein